MTVKELITELQKYPPENQVEVSNWFEGFYQAYLIESVVPFANDESAVKRGCPIELRMGRQVAG